MAVDADLVASLKLAKGGKKMFFAFIPKGGDGKLIISKKKIPPKDIAEAKKEIGGGAAVTGKCFGPYDNMVFQVAKQAPPTLGVAIKKAVKRDAGLNIVADVQLAGDADAEEEAGETAASAAAPAQGAAPAAGDTAAPAASAAPKGQANVTGIQKGLQKLGYDPGKIDGVMGPHTQAAIKKFQQDHGLAADGIVGPKTQAALAKALQGGGSAAPETAAQDAASAGAGAGGAKAPASKAIPNMGHWQTVRQQAITDLKALATKVAGTKHGSAAGVLKEIQAIISKLPASPAIGEIDKLENFVRNDDTITAAEEVPGHFHSLSIREPLLQALEALKQ